MKWTRSKQADKNFRDARTGGSTRGRRSGGGGGGRGGAAVGVGGMGIIGLILALLFGGNVFGGGGGAGSLDSVGGASAPPAAEVALDDTNEQFFNFLLTDVQDFWVDKFAENGIPYREATMTLFDTPIRTGCGSATAQIGPHYCPLDKGIYLELGFFEQILDRRFGASGDFAQAYVIAHEFGHHVQSELGISSWVREQQARNPRDKNAYSIALELQADCLAGVWAAWAEDRGLLHRGDIAEALRAAEAVGDDRIQQSSGQRVNPHGWTHGSAAQRQQWLEIGLDTADTEACDTFS